MMIFWIFLLFLILQRIAELIIANRNERWLKARGAIEFGSEHYGLLVAMHTAFFVSLLLEVLVFNLTITPIWPAIVPLFIIVQILRVWVIASLGRFWNTKIIVLPQATVVKKGPYKWLKHPNYVVVALELVIVPLLFQAYLTMFLFSALNIIVLSIRIPAEEKILKQWTNYEKEFQQHSRFFPSFLRKE